MTRQNIILSRINAAGALQATTGASDANKVIKTDASGKLDPSLISGSVIYSILGTNYIPSIELLPQSLGNNELFSEEYIVDTNEPCSKYMAIFDNQAIKLVYHTLVISDDTVFGQPTAFSLRYKFSDNDPPDLNILLQAYKNHTTLLQDENITVNTSWNTESFARDAGPATMAAGDILSFVLTINADADQYVLLNNLTYYLEDGS
jgi:hypothetical protein